jgi:hypothetical protein
MALTETQVVAAELETVQSKVPVLFDRDSLFYGNVEKRPAEKVSNRDMRVPMEIRPGGRFGYFSPDGGDLGRGDGQSFEKALVSTVHLKHGVEWQKRAQWATDDSRKSVVNAFRQLLAKAMAEFRRQVDSSLMTGGDGAVATITSIATAAGKDTYTCTTDGFGVRLLRYGQFVSIYNSTFAAAKVITPSGDGTLVGTAAQIDQVDYANKTFRIRGATTTPALGDRVVIEGLSGANPVALLGVPYHHNNASTGTWLGLDRAQFPEIRANRVNAAGPLALAHARLALNRIGDRIGLDNGTKVTAWMHPCQVQAYEELGQMAQVITRTGSSNQKLDLYFDVQQIAGAPIRRSYSWDKTRIDFIVNEVWGRAEMNPPGFYEEEGRRLFELRGPSGGVATATIFYIVASFNTFVNNPAACAYIDGLTVPSGY